MNIGSDTLEDSVIAFAGFNLDVLRKIMSKTKEKNPPCSVSAARESVEYCEMDIYHQELILWLCDRVEDLEAGELEIAPVERGIPYTVYEARGAAKEHGYLMDRYHERSIYWLCNRVELLEEELKEDQK